MERYIACYCDELFMGVRRVVLQGRFVIGLP